MSETSRLIGMGDLMTDDVSGAAFCAGADLKEVLTGRKLGPGEPDFLDRANVVLGRLRNLRKPVIAALNGVAMAGGLELAMCADLVVAAESATIADAHSNFGVYPGAGGAAILPRLIPLNMAMYFLFTGKSFSAEMQAPGLVCEVTPDEGLAEGALALADHIARKSPASLRLSPGNILSAQVIQKSTFDRHSRTLDTHAHPFLHWRRTREASSL